jgi:GAF domain-containing protein
MAKKRKDLTGQLDGLFADFAPEPEEEAKVEEEKPAEPIEAKPVEPVVEMPAVDVLFAEEPVAAEVVEVEPVEIPAEAPAIDALLAAEPVAVEEVAPPVVEEIELMEPARAEPEVVEPVAVEPMAVEEEVEPEAHELAAEAVEVEHVAARPMVAEAVEEVEPEPAELEMVELPSLAGLPAVEEIKAAVAEEAVPEAVEVELEAPEPVVAEAAEEPELAKAEAPVPGLEKVERAVPPGKPPGWEATIREQRTRILNVLLGLITIVATVVVSSLVIFSLDRPALWVSYTPYFFAWAVLVFLTLARRLNPLWRTAGLVVLAYLVGTLSLWIDGPLGAGWLYLLLAPLMLSTLVGRRPGVYAAVGSFGIYLAMSIAYKLGWREPAGVLSDLTKWSTVLNTSSTYGLVLAAATLIQWMFNSSLITSLREVEEKHVEAVRAQEALRGRAEELAKINTTLQKRTLQLETASQVSQAASSVLDPDELMQQAVDLIRERFNLYYVGLFLTRKAGAGDGADTGWQEVMLKAGTGEAGRRMLEQGYSVEVGDDSAVGRCTARGQAHVAHEAPSAGSDLLPYTRSEAALPLRSRGRVLGALDVCSTDSEAFAEEDISVLQTMADHIAVTIDNAQLFAELRRRLAEMEASQRLYVRERWTDLVPRLIAPVYQRTQPDVAPLSGAALSEAGQAVSQEKVVVQSGADGGADQASLVAPIALRGEIIGALGLQEAESERQWTEDEVALIETVADQMALAIENVRLLEETRQLAGWEQTLSDMTARFTRSLDTETLLRTAIHELGQLLQVDEVSVHIGVPGGSASADGGEA